jgi:glutamate racemase
MKPNNDSYLNLFNLNDVKNNNLIAIFDSGSGGLICLKHLLKNKMLSNMNFVYFADIKNMPYGNKEFSLISEYTLKIFRYLKNIFSPYIIINACNTSISTCSDVFLNNNKFENINIFNIIDPFLKYISFENKKILILATKSTSENKIFEKILQSRGVNFQSIYNCSCDELASLTELYLSQNFEQKDIEKKIDAHLDIYLRDFLDIDIDYLIYGCSHYPHLHNLILKYIEKKNLKINEIIDPSAYIGIDISKIINKDIGLNCINNIFNIGNYLYEIKSNKFEKNIRNITFIINGQNNNFEQNIKNSTDFEQYNKKFIYIDI